MSFDSTIVPPVRRMRTDMLVAHVMHIVGRYIRTDDARDLHRQCVSDLYDSFYKSGVEVITDETRRQVGLSPRGEEGWTAEELHALEAKRMETLTRPITFAVPVGDMEGVDLTSPGFIINKDPK